MDNLGRVAIVFDHMPKHRAKFLYYPSGELNHRDVLEFLRLSRKDIAKLSSISPESVRFDSQMPKRMADLFVEFVYLIELVLDVFDGDKLKTETWFVVSNLNFGGISPSKVIKIGQIEKLRNMIVNARRSSV